jgi:hypothetical protein
MKSILLYNIIRDRECLGIGREEMIIEYYETGARIKMKDNIKPLNREQINFLVKTINDAMNVRVFYSSKEDEIVVIRPIDEDVEIGFGEAMDKESFKFLLSNIVYEVLGREEIIYENQKLKKDSKISSLHSITKWLS